MYLSLNKLRSKYGKRIYTRYIHCIKNDSVFLYTLYKARRKSESSFPHSFFNHFSFVSNAKNFVIHSLSRFVHDFYVETIANSVQSQNTYSYNFNLINDSRLYNSHMRIGTYLDQTDN